MKKRAYNAGDIILKEGDPSDVVYKIVSGDVEVFKEQDGQTIVLGAMKAGEFLGEMGVVDDEPRSASARAKNQVSVIIYEEQEFFRLISKSKNITVLWSEPPEELILKYINLGFAEEDAAIAACVEWVGAEYLISENRHFLSRSEQVAFEIVDAETALSLLQV